MKAVQYQTGPDLSKICKGTPSKINEEAKYLLLDYLTRKEDGKYVNQHLVGMPLPDMGLTLEWIYRQQTQPNPKMPKPNQACMSEECRVWAGLDRIDPCIDSVWIKDPNSIFCGVLHTWGHVGRVFSREQQIYFIEKMEIN